MDFVLGSFSRFNIEIAYSNFTFCDAWTPKFLSFKWKMSKFQLNEHTPGNTIKKSYKHLNIDVCIRQTVMAKNKFKK